MQNLEALIKDTAEILSMAEPEPSNWADWVKYLRENLDQATFEGKRRILDMLDVHGTLALENDERVLYLTCAIYPQPASLVLTSPCLYSSS